MAPRRIWQKARKAATSDGVPSGEPADAACCHIRPALRVGLRGPPASSASLADGPPSPSACLLADRLCATATATAIPVRNAGYPSCMGFWTSNPYALPAKGAGMTVVLSQRRDINLDSYRRVAWQGEAVRLSDAALKA